MGESSQRRELLLNVSIMDEQAIRRAVVRMAGELVERNEGPSDLAIMGIQRRGVQIADLIRTEVKRAEGVELPFGTLDITLYRDDLMVVGPRPVVGESVLPSGGIDGRAVVLVDDVLFTGRTIRAALNERMDWGRPSRVVLCVLIDRGGREIPVQPDVVGRAVSVLPNHTVDVSVPEIDGKLAVDIVKVTTGAE